jgi:hypothetical protein
MGIDIYARWRNQTEQERDAQDIFSVVSGGTGYLREAYHGAPYVTKYLVQEAFAARYEEGAKIPAETLRERLPAAVLLAIIREKKVYGSGNPGIIDAAELPKALKNVVENEVGDMSHKEIAESFTPETLENIQRLIDNKLLSDVVQSFVDFVEFCEAIEKKTGEPVTIIASY